MTGSTEADGCGGQASGKVTGGSGHCRDDEEEIGAERVWRWNGIGWPLVHWGAGRQRETVHEVGHATTGVPGEAAPGTVGILLVDTVAPVDFGGRGTGRENGEGAGYVQCTEGERGAAAVCCGFVDVRGGSAQTGWSRERERTRSDSEETAREDDDGSARGDAQEAMCCTVKSCRLEELA